MDTIDIRVNGHKRQWDSSHKLLTKGLSSAKIAKSEKFQGGKYSTMVLHLAPASISGYNMCPGSSKGCRKACLNQSGQGGMTQGEIGSKRLEDASIHIARVGRTTLLKEYPDAFFMKLKAELNTFLTRCGIKESIPCIRLNGTSDVNWMTLKDPATNKSIIEEYPEIQFYDYTKVYGRLNQSKKFFNYHLTFSLSENNHKQGLQALEAGFNLTAVFDSNLPIPETFLNYPVFTADDTDLRFIDNELYNHKGAMVMHLKEKGYMGMRDKSGFVVREL
jgi:hypothetical protein